MNKEDLKPLIVVVGDPNSVFPFAFGSYFVENGYRVNVVSRYPYPNRKIFNEKIPYVNSRQFESKLLKLTLILLARVLILFEKIANIFLKSKLKNEISDSIVQSKSISNYLNKLKTPPEFVYVQQVLTYGPVSSFYRKTPTVLMPWGGEVFNRGSQNKVIKKAIKINLKNASLINPSSISAISEISEAYNIPKDKFYATLNFAGRDDILSCMAHKSKQSLREKYGIKDSEKVIFNVRRFQKKWGSTEAAEAFKILAKRNKNFKFILVAGEGAVANQLLKDAEKQFDQENIRDQFIIFYNHISLEEYSELLVLTDVALSIMHAGDMRSASIMMAVTANCLPVISKQAEYYVMQEEGFKCQFVDYDDIEAIVSACEKYIFDEQFAAETLRQNQLFLDKFPDNDKFLELLLDKIKKSKT